MKEGICKKQREGREVQDLCGSQRENDISYWTENKITS